MTQQKPDNLALFETLGILGPDDTVMSNFDGAVVEGAEEALRNGFWGRHAGWNFNGSVWYKDGLFKEDVFAYHVYQTTLMAPTLQELMEKVNDEFGAE
ncbi:hypothetical protein LCGC14_1003030 [marine sediment metagenome]|uniref:Uncharacterized protein n=1 Tax=marine sediment metagenome TaxID=412755 RepID=A0A0F9R8I6_9ZZZZ